MAFDIAMIRGFYAALPARIEAVRKELRRPLTLAEKILYAHLYTSEGLRAYERGSDYATFRPDRVAMQDATAQMALLQFMNAGKAASVVPATVHCDHLITAADGAAHDLPAAQRENAEVYDFLRTAAARYGIGFWQAGSGIIHQVVLENYAFPGGMMVGTDSHTPNAGGLGMAAIGVGGADAVDVMAGMEWELKFPRIIGVQLKGKLSGWTSPKDVILHLAGLLTVKGGTNAIIEYFGEGTAALSCTGKATICNMGAEVGATTSMFPYDERMATYLRATGRGDVAALADEASACLRADEEVTRNPEAYYDKVITIDLSQLTPYVNGPFTPDAAHPAAEMPARVAREGYPDAVEVVLIGSCTNSSYEDLTRAASVVRAAEAAGLRPRAQFIINPGSEQIRATAERDGLLPLFRKAGAIVMTNACGPCIGQWRRKTDDNTRPNSIVTTFNRNFAKRADGNPATHAFITSPEAAAGYAYTGRLSVHPSFAAGYEALMPEGSELPAQGFAPCENGYLAPAADAPAPIIRAESERLQRLAPFAPWDGGDLNALRLLVKTRGKCTTDHISPAGPWLKYRGHMQNITRNLLLGATNAFTGETGTTLNALTGETDGIANTALAYKAAGEGCIVVAEENYGEGSSREHAAMEPRYAGVRAILSKSFARIHETNLKKQGVLALTFRCEGDYDRVRADDRISLSTSQLQPGHDVTVTLLHADGTSETFAAAHTYNAQQIAWLRAGSALNSLAAAQ